MNETGTSNQAIIRRSRVEEELRCREAIAVENVSLYEETKRRVDEVETLFNVQQAITSRLDPDVVLQMIADHARRLTSSQQPFAFLTEGERLQEAERARLAKGCEAHMSMLTYLKGRLVMWIPALCKLLSPTPKESANPRNGRPTMVHKPPCTPSE